MADPRRAAVLARRGRADRAGRLNGAGASLFDDEPTGPIAHPRIAGLLVEPGFLSVADEAALIALLGTLPFAPAVYKGYTARRRVVSFGGSFDYDTNRLEPAAPLPDALRPLRDRVAAWGGVAPEALVHALAAEYAPGTPLGWHRDVPDFERVFGVSLGSPARLRWRPYPPAPAGRRGDVVTLVLPPRSVYGMAGAARWDWQHSVAPVDALRWSITFRTARRGA